jgi:hypothetical protein
VRSERLAAHAAFITDYENKKGAARHRNAHYGFPVVTSQETDLLLPSLSVVSRETDGRYRVSYDSHP